MAVNFKLAGSINNMFDTLSFLFLFISLRSMKLIIVLLIFSIAVKAKGIDDCSFDQFYSKKIESSKGLLIVNFWATWCKPCLAELPVFEKMNAEMDSSVKVILANLDFNSQYKKSVPTFIHKSKIESEVVHINDTDPNSWIDKIEKKWSGAIPATVIYFDAKKVFFKEGEISYEELKTETNKIKNQ